MTKERKHINDDVPYDPFKDEKWITDRERLRSKKKEQEKTNYIKNNGLWIDMDYLDLIDGIKKIKKRWKKEIPLNGNDELYRKKVKEEYKLIKQKDEFLEYCDSDWFDHHNNELDSMIDEIKKSLKYYEIDGRFNNDSYESDMGRIKSNLRTDGEVINWIEKREKDWEEKKEKLLKGKVNKKKRKTPIQSKGSLEVLKILKEILGDDIEIKEEYKFTTNRLFRLDFYFEYNDRKIGVEYQGLQHFKPIKFFGGMRTYLKGKYWDMEKKDLCEHHDIELIYFYYDETITKELILERLGIS